MLTPTIYEDAETRSELFLWFGIDVTLFDGWLGTLPFSIHPDLVDFWRRTGGGDIFESETLLGPLASDQSENVLGMTEFHKRKGLPDGLLIFHLGMCISALSVDRNHGRSRLVTLEDDSYQITGSFDTFNGWYQNVLRAEYSSRYGM